MPQIPWSTGRWTHAPEHVEEVRRLVFDSLDASDVDALSVGLGKILESLDLPGADLSALSAEELSVQVLPKQSDEFTCAGCFLVRHRSQIAEQRANGDAYCYDCAG